MLFLVRHGRTAINVGNKLQGRIDHPLDEVGRQQAVEIASVLKSIDRVVSSPLIRAKQTADAFGLPVEVDPRFIELDYGDFDGMLQKDVSALTWKEWRDDNNFRPPNGETLVELDLRVREALNELVEEARTANIVVVSHVSPIKAAIAWTIGTDVGSCWRMLLDRASISRIEITENGPSMRGFNDTSHLKTI
jgi:broad specificity phosphatase PhoE